jgi:glutamate dehydrogenase
MPKLLVSPDVEPLLKASEEFESAGVPPSLAMRVASLPSMVAALDVVDIAAETGLEVQAVAAVHFRLGSRLELHWLRDRIVDLPRDDRWGALARAALRDDLYGLHRALTAEVLQGADMDDPDALVRDWVSRQPGAERTLETLADIRVGHNYDLTTLPVAVREVRNLLNAPD